MLNIDWICLAVILILAILGFRRGLVGEFFRILSLTAGLLAGFALSLRWAHKIEIGGVLGSKVAVVLMFLVSFALAAGLVLLIGKLVQKVIRLTLLGWFDRLGGVIIGLIKGTMIAGFLVWSATFLPFLDMQAKLGQSKIAGRSVQITSFLLKTSRSLVGSRGIMPKLPLPKIIGHPAKKTD